MGPRLDRVLKTADALITVLSTRVDDALLAKAPKLKVVANYAVGYNNIDVEACARRGVRVVNTPKVLTRATAELALTLLLAAARRVPEGEAMCRAGEFHGWEPDMLLGLRLEGRNAVIFGAGRIGTETARLFEAIGMTVEFIKRDTPQREVTAKLKRAQVLSLHAPLTPQTQHWLDAKRIALLPRDSIIINTARGPVIDEAALIRALKARKIFAAGLDVFEREPEIPAELRKLPNAVLLPHLGSATVETRAEMASLAIQGVLQILRGGNPWNEIKHAPRH